MGSALWLAGLAGVQVAIYIDGVVLVDLVVSSVAGDASVFLTTDVIIWCSCKSCMF